MARIAYILLCHKDPESIVRQARRLTAMGDFIAIHFDARADPKDYALLRTELASNPNVIFTKRREKCGWGEWSLVRATLNALIDAEDAFPTATHFYMLSGDCMPIKSARYAHDFLDADDVDYIESFDFFGSDWIKTGIKEERLVYRHFWNERKFKWLFYKSMDFQRRLGLKRKIPADLQIMIGSQWWCLRRRTVEAVLAFCEQRRDVLRFFSTTWIPDETFFQTIVRHLVAGNEIRSRTLTFLLFSDYGMPVTFYNDHYDLLLGQDCLFARKISEGAVDLKKRLGALYAQDDATFEISNEGRSLYKFLQGRGRIGQRIAPRFWEKESSIGRERTLFLVVCKKWHVAKRLSERISQVSGIPSYNYLFDEEDSPLPDLGGIQKGLGKRTRHRRAIMRMLFDYHGTDKLLLCVDPARLDLISDFNADRATTKVLEVECQFSDDYLKGHARRMGLAGERTPKEALDRLLPTIRNDVFYESDRLHQSDVENLFRLAEWDTSKMREAVFLDFLGVAQDEAEKIAAHDHLFAD